MPESFAVRLPDGVDDLEAAPLLCAGSSATARCSAEVEPGDRVALMGFGASAHLALQVLRHWGCEPVVLTRGERHRELARSSAPRGSATRGAPAASCDRAVVFAPRASWCPSRCRWCDRAAP
ncbi:MAG: hypothetical protein U0W40_07405 [Acidimicrobiia bacterium]